MNDILSVHDSKFFVLFAEQQNCFFVTVLVLKGFKKYASPSAIIVKNRTLMGMFPVENFELESISLTCLI
jgi:hypothetical protein